MEWLEETGAIMFAVEHRYYGCHNLSSCPVPSFASPDDLRFLSSAQALEDLAHFVGYATAAYNLTGCQWVAWGGRCCCPLCPRPFFLALVLQAAATRAPHTKPCVLALAVTQECWLAGCV